MIDKIKSGEMKPVISQSGISPLLKPLISQEVKPAISVLDKLKREDITLQKRN
jgi:hypothetical protein